MKTSFGKLDKAETEEHFGKTLENKKDIKKKSRADSKKTTPAEEQLSTNIKEITPTEISPPKK